MFFISAKALVLAHFRHAQRDLPHYLASTPRIVTQDIAQNDRSELGIQ